ncbi:MAG: hypothetical protein CSA62_14130 [Planctomycetota bacterium]|nr:MAG: hypothetical protein CSA62_14130 [Planctomycetota bacterium]
MWGMAIHLSQFCGYLVPLAGLIVPILIWQTKKNDSPIIDRHGRIVANWMMTVIPLAAIFFVLTLAIIGLPLLIVLGVIVIIFPVVGAIKAQSGEAWKYPGSIPFFRVSDPE